MSPVAIDWSKVDRPALVFDRFPSRRSVVYGVKGIVSSSQPLATEAGLEILRKGGNAGAIFRIRCNTDRVLRRICTTADAAVATSAALNVTEPTSCGIGGLVLAVVEQRPFKLISRDWDNSDAFCLFYDAKTKTVQALNGSGRAPQKLSVKYAQSRGLVGSIPYTDLNSVTVPGPYDRKIITSTNC